MYALRGQQVIRASGGIRGLVEVVGGIGTIRGCRGVRGALGLVGCRGVKEALRPSRV